MNICVVSTYFKGKYNIGDFLITQSCEALLHDVCREITGVSPSIKRLFRGAEWCDVRSDIESCDICVIACLAIRKDLKKYFRYIEELLSVNIPIAVVSAGSATNVYGKRLNLDAQISEEDRELLKRLSSKSIIFSTRDELTQYFLELNGIEATFTGDVAFYSGDISSLRFGAPDRIDLIAISDPHYSEWYIDSFRTLVLGLRRLFPLARLELFLHGVNDGAVKLAVSEGIEYKSIYKDKDYGLSAYDRVDLHIGYRVHGHVSALSRGKPSYLLEQDGRGAGYGITFARRISMPSFRPPPRSGRAVSNAGAQILLAMLSSDKRNGFRRFEGLEYEINQTRSTLFNVLSNIVNSVVGAQEPI